KIRGMGADCHMHIYADDEEIGVLDIGHSDGEYSTYLKSITGRHAVYFKITTDYNGWTADFFKNRTLFELVSFVFTK
ncbi:MAG: xylan 1,4-beta-xylosidase, partial [Oscillospiraceae bacterium]|nr:xylan 1,4-beta-xylosidase [Oscillospiraceae bacterium]